METLQFVCHCGFQFKDYARLRRIYLENQPD